MPIYISIRFYVQAHLLVHKLSMGMELVMGSPSPMPIPDHWDEDWYGAGPIQLAGSERGHGVECE